MQTPDSAGIYLFKVNNGNTRATCEICSKLIIKTLFWCFHCWLWTSKCRLGSSLSCNPSGVFIIHFNLNGLIYCFYLQLWTCICLLEMWSFFKADVNDFALATLLLTLNKFHQIFMRQNTRFTDLVALTQAF